MERKKIIDLLEELADQYQCSLAICCCIEAAARTIEEAKSNPELVRQRSIVRAIESAAKMLEEDAKTIETLTKEKNQAEEVIRIYTNDQAEKIRKIYDELQMRELMAERNQK